MRNYSYYKIRSLKASHPGSTEQTIPEMIEHSKPDCKRQNINVKLSSNLYISTLQFFIFYKKGFLNNTLR